MKYLVIDLETGIKEMHGRKGNPWYNEIVAVGYKPQDTPFAYSEYSNDCLIGLDKHLEPYKILVGHNIKFDLLYLWKYEAFQGWLKKGGKIWDTQLAEYILTGQQSKYSALRDLAVNKYGRTKREKKMESYWAKDVDTKDIPVELVLEDVKNDVLDTEQIMLQQVKQAKKDDSFNLIMEMNESLLATTEMEYNGIYVDQKVMHKNKELVINELNCIYKELGGLSEKYWK